MRLWEDLEQNSAITVQSMSLLSMSQISLPRAEWYKDFNYFSFVYWLSLTGCWITESSMGGLLGSEDASSRGPEPLGESSQLAPPAPAGPATAASAAPRRFPAPGIHSAMGYVEDEALRTTFLEIGEDCLVLSRKAFYRWSWIILKVYLDLVYK